MQTTAIGKMSNPAGPQHLEDINKSSNASHPARKAERMMINAMAQMSFDLDMDLSWLVAGRNNYSYSSKTFECRKQRLDIVDD